MSSKDEILERVKRDNIVKDLGLPSYTNFGIRFENPHDKFCEMIKNVGGEALFIKKEALYETILQLYPNEKNIASNIEELRDRTENPNSQADPHKLQDIDLAVVKGEFAIAENGAVWINNRENRHRTLYFIAQNIIIVVDKNSIVNNMHEAYEKIEFNDLTYGVFVSGPSKTADIEQSLVIGAHGPKSGYVIFTE